ncbi:hypothetical protein PMAYCL1PPCAC_01591, partial [Pristionchus mayeri]
SLADFSLFAHLLRNSSFGLLEAGAPVLDDTIAPIILSWASHAQEILFECDKSQLSHPASFFAQMASCACSAFLRDHSSSTSSYFG